MKNILLASDLDDTLIGDNEGQRRFNELVATVPSIKLAYVTGRSLNKYNALKEERPLAEPAALVTALGTEIYIHTNRVAEWPRAEGWNRNDIVKKLSVFSALRPQPDSEQRDYKVSYFLDSDPTLIPDIKKALSSCNVDISYSMDRYLDVLPKDVNKGAALKYLANLWGVESGNIYACGDSLNDISMLEAGKAIVVGNAKPELKAWSYGKGEQVYEAQQSYADGIVEGLKYFQVLT